jgi:hypothetical protein
MPSRWSRSSKLEYEFNTDEETSELEGRHARRAEGKYLKSAGVLLLML